MSLGRKILSSAIGGVALCGIGTAALAGSEIQPGITTGIALGAPLPQGVFVITMPNYGYRDATPGQSVGAVVPAWIIWSTPWEFLGGHILLDTVSPMVNVNVHGVANRGGFANPAVDAQIKWDLGNGFFGGFQTGVYLPVEDDLSVFGISRNFASFQAIGALSYLKDGWNLTSTVIYGTGRSGDVFSAPGSYGPDWLNVDLTATKKFGKFEIAQSDLAPPILLPPLLDMGSRARSRSAASWAMNSAP
jgi:hypothetical protein